MSVTQGAVRSIYNEASPRSPVLQVTDARPIVGPDGQPQTPQRFRVSLSDGQHFLQAMVTSQLNTMFTNDEVAINFLVKLDEYIINTVQERKFVIILGMTVVSKAPTGPIGDPKDIESSNAGSAAAPAPAASTTMAPAAAAAAGTAPVHRPNGGGRATFPIKSLNPYQNRWTIKARVTQKQPVKTWTNDRGSGRLMSVEFMDADGDKIRATMFNDAVDRFDPVLEEGRVYYVSGGTLKFANKKFTTIKHDYEMTLNSNAEVELCRDADEIPQHHFDFVTIADIGTVEPDSVIDVLGIVTNIGELAEITTKAGKQLSKRVVTLLDASRASIELTLWGETAEGWTCDGVVAINGCKVSDYNGRSLSTLFASKIIERPQLEAAKKLQQWYEGQGRTEQISSLSTGAGFASGGERQARDPAAMNFVADIQQYAIGRRGAGDEFIMVKATVTKIRTEGTMWYSACPSDSCNKKVTPMNEKWQCDKCAKVYDECQYRYVMRMSVADHTGTETLSFFNDQAVKILGVTAGELKGMQEGNKAAFDRVVNEAQFKQWIFRLRCREDTYNDEARLQVSVSNLWPLNFSRRLKDLTVLNDRYGELRPDPEQA